MNNKDLLKQYCDTGLQLSNYQIQRIPNNLKNTYTRKRIQVVEQPGGGELNKEEFALTSEEYKIKSINDTTECNSFLGEGQFAFCNDDDYKSGQIRKRLTLLDTLKKYEWDWCTDDLKIKYINTLISWEVYLKKYEWDWCSDKLKYKVLKLKLEEFSGLTEWEFMWCSEQVKQQYIKGKIKNDIYIDEFEFLWCSDELKVEYIRSMMGRRVSLPVYAFEWCSDELKLEFINKKRAINTQLVYDEIHWLDTYRNKIKQ